MRTSVADLQEKKVPRWSRLAAAVVQKCWRAGEAEGRTHSELAKETTVPRTTEGYWREREAARAASPEEVPFFESPAGLEVMHRILLAIHLVLGFEPQRGIRGVCTFLELSGLSAFMGASYGTQQKVAQEHHGL
jgi:hypothetical protein